MRFTKKRVLLTVVEVIDCKTQNTTHSLPPDKHKLSHKLIFPSRKFRLTIMCRFLLANSAPDFRLTRKRVYPTRLQVYFTSVCVLWIDVRVRRSITFFVSDVVYITQFIISSIDMSIKVSTWPRFEGSSFIRYFCQLNKWRISFFI